MPKDYLGMKEIASPSTTDSARISAAITSAKTQDPRFPTYTPLYTATDSTGNSVCLLRAMGRSTLEAQFVLWRSGQGECRITSASDKGTGQIDVTVKDKTGSKDQKYVFGAQKGEVMFFDDLEKSDPTSTTLTLTTDRNKIELIIQPLMKKK